MGVSDEAAVVSHVARATNDIYTHRHYCGTAFRPTYDSPTLLFISSAGR